MTETLIVLPGDDLTTHLLASSADASSTVKVGHGLTLDPATQRLSCEVAGKLIQRGVKIGSDSGGPSSGTGWQLSVDSWTHQRHYFPKVGDQIVGIIDEKMGDFYTVNIFAGMTTMLSRVGFEGATKRNKPELKRGDVIYAIVCNANPQERSELEITCIGGSSASSRKDWSSGETVYGPLANGLLIHVSIGMARRLLRPDCVVLMELSKHFTFEVAIGINGAVWLRCVSGVLDTIIIRNILLNAETLDDAQSLAMIDQVLKLANKARRRAL